MDFESNQLEEVNWDRIGKAVGALTEHFDSVLIIATLAENKNTRMFVQRYGNWHAVFGSAYEWVRKQQAFMDAAGDSDPEDDE